MPILALAAVALIGAGPYVSPEIPLDPSAPLSERHDEIAVSTGVGGWLAVWQDDRGGASGLDIRAVSVGPTGLVSPPGGRTVSALPAAESLPAVAFMAGTSVPRYFVLWQATASGLSRIHAAQILPDTTPFITDYAIAETTTGQQTGPAIACAPNACLAAWSDTRNDSAGDIFAIVIMESSVTPAGGFPVATGPAAQRNPAIDFDGTRFMVVWTETTAGTGRTMAARVGSDGVVADAAGFAVGSGLGSETAPDVAFAAGSHLVIWQDARAGSPGIYGRITSGPPATGPEIPIAIGNALQRPTVGSSGAQFLAAWQDRTTRATVFDLFGARITTAGRVLDAPPFVVTSELPDEIVPDLSMQSSGLALVGYTSATAARARLVGPRGCATHVDCMSGVACSIGSCVADMCVAVDDPVCALDASTPDASLTDAIAVDDVRDVPASPRDDGTAVGDAAAADASDIDVQAPPADAEVPRTGPNFRGGACACETPRRTTGSNVPIGAIVATLLASAVLKRRHTRASARAAPGSSRLPARLSK